MISCNTQSRITFPLFQNSITRNSYQPTHKELYYHKVKATQCFPYHPKIHFIHSFARISHNISHQDPSTCKGSKRNLHRCFFQCLNCRKLQNFDIYYFHKYWNHGLSISIVVLEILSVLNNLPWQHLSYILYWLFLYKTYCG